MSRVIGPLLNLEECELEYDCCVGLFKSQVEEEDSPGRQDYESKHFLKSTLHVGSMLSAHDAKSKRKPESEICPGLFLYVQPNTATPSHCATVSPVLGLTSEESSAQLRNLGAVIEGTIGGVVFFFLI